MGRPNNNSDLNNVIIIVKSQIAAVNAILKRLFSHTFIFLKYNLRNSYKI